MSLLHSVMPVKMSMTCG